MPADLLPKLAAAIQAAPDAEAAWLNGWAEGFIAGHALAVGRDDQYVLRRDEMIAARAAARTDGREP